MPVFLFLVSVSLGHCMAQNPLVGHRQALVVTTPLWDSVQGTIQLFERGDDSAPWIPLGQLMPVVVGSGGLAWGIGLHPQLNQQPVKIEGDGKSPAGIFSLGTAFGFSPLNEMGDLHLEYLQINEQIEAVDDPLSGHYNCIVDRKAVVCDWNSSEKMAQHPLYECGVLVCHNTVPRIAGRGSAIFFIYGTQSILVLGVVRPLVERLFQRFCCGWIRKNNRFLFNFLFLSILNMKQNGHCPRCQRGIGILPKEIGFIVY